MAAFNFPNSPSVNDTHTENSVTFKWNGTIWNRVGVAGAQGATGAAGAQGAQGAQGHQGVQGAANATTINSNTNNYLITGTGTANTIQGEANLTFDGDILRIKDASNDGALSQVIKLGNDSSGAGTGSQINLGVANGNESTSACINGFLDSAGGTSFAIKTAGTYANQGTVAERARIDSSGRLLIGATSVDPLWGVSASLAVEGTTGNASAINISRNSNDGSPPYLTFGKSRGTSIGSDTVVQSGDTLGTIAFVGADGTDKENSGALIAAEVDGTPGSNDMPGRLVFKTTADGASSSTERLRIDSSGNIGIGTASPTARFDVRRSDADGLIAEFHTSTGYGIDIGSSQSVAYISSGSSQDFIFKSNAGSGQTERLRIKSDGTVQTNGAADIKIADGNLVRGTAGHGIDFSANSHATGMTSELFDSYEEGTWTPTVFSTSAGTFTYLSQHGVYTKIGNWVFCTGIVQATVGGTESGLIRIGELPFNSVNLSGIYAQVLITDYGNWDSYTGHLGGYVEKGDNHIVLLHINEGVSSTVATSDWGTNTYVYFSFSYRI